jgi:hypothetical protein
MKIRTIRLLTFTVVVGFLSLLMVRGYKIIFPTIIIINDPFRQFVHLGLGLILVLGLLAFLTIYRDYCQYRDFYMDPDTKLQKDQEKEKRLEKIRPYLLPIGSFLYDWLS